MPRVASGESVVDRVVRILTAFDAPATSMTMTQLARRSGLHIATASRLVAQMASYGLLQRDADGCVRVGLRMWELGARAAPAVSLREAALPFMEDVRATVGHHVKLAICDGTEVIFIERLAAPNAVPDFSRVASRLPLHVSCSGLVLLASSPREVQERVLAGPLPAMTKLTITDPLRLRRLLAEIRRQGFALLDGHFRTNVAGVAVPVRGAIGQVVAAVSIIAPSEYGARQMVGLLQACARGISRTLVEPHTSRLIH